MATPLVADTGSLITITGNNAINSGYYTDDAVDPITVSNSNYLLAWVRLKFGFTTTAPTVGSVQLFKLPWSLDGTPLQGPATTGGSGAGTFATGVTPVLVGTFNTSYLTTAAWSSLPGPIPLDPKASYYIYNNGTAQVITAGWVLEFLPWSPGV